MSVEIKNEDLKSVSDKLKAFVRFHNNTNRNVDVIWLDYEGQRVKYETLHPEEYLDMNTYVTHPWIFRDSTSQAKLLGNREEVYQPQTPVLERSNNNAQLHPKQTIVYITLPVYTLKVRCLEVVRTYLTKLEDAENLCIPRTLQAELLQPCV